MAVTVPERASPDFGTRRGRLERRNLSGRADIVRNVPGANASRGDLYRVPEAGATGAAHRRRCAPTAAAKNHACGTAHHRSGTPTALPAARTGPRRCRQRGSLRWAPGIASTVSSPHWDRQGAIGVAPFRTSCSHREEQSSTHRHGIATGRPTNRDTVHTIAGQQH